MNQILAADQNLMHLFIDPDYNLHSNEVECNTHQKGYDRILGVKFLTALYCGVLHRWEWQTCYVPHCNYRYAANNII